MAAWFVPPMVVPLLLGVMVVGYALWRAFL